MLELDFSPFIDGAESDFELAYTEGISRTTAALGSEFYQERKEEQGKLPCVTPFH
jgi:hypothetical protein